MDSCPSEIGYVASPQGYVNILHVLTCLEIPFHLFGAYVILFKTPKQMQSVKWLILNLHFWSALEDIYTSLVFTPFVLFPVMSGWGLGIEFYPVFGIYVFVTVLAAVASAVVLIFENRYFVLFAKNRNKFWCKYRVVFLIINNFLVVFYFTPPYFTIPEQKTAVAIVNKSIKCLVMAKNREQYVLTLDHQLVFWCLVVVLSVFTFQISAMSIFLSYKLLTQSSTATSRQTQRMQMNLVLALAAQSFVPILVIVAPVLIILHSIYFWDYNQTRNNLIFIALSVHGLISTLVMIFIHRPYRNFVLSPAFQCFEAFRARRYRIGPFLFNRNQRPATLSSRY